MMSLQLYKQTIRQCTRCLKRSAPSISAVRLMYRPPTQYIHTTLLRTQKLAPQLNTANQPESTQQAPTCYSCKQSIEHIKTHKLSPVLQYCVQCNKLQQPIHKLNYYEIFQLNTYTYNIDKQKLTKQYKALQRILHPDLFTNSMTEEQTISADISSLVNTAYTLLMNDYNRAIYLLELNNVVWEKTNNSLNNSTELIYVMEIREQIDEYIDKKQYDELRQLNEDNETKISEILNKLNDTLSPNNQQLKLTQEQIDQSLPYVAKLSYLIQIQQTIHADLPST